MKLFLSLVMILHVNSASAWLFRFTPKKDLPEIILKDLIARAQHRSGGPVYSHCDIDSSDYSNDGDSYGSYSTRENGSFHVEVDGIQVTNDIHYGSFRGFNSVYRLYLNRVLTEECQYPLPTKKCNIKSDRQGDQFVYRGGRMFGYFSNYTYKRRAAEYARAYLDSLRLLKLCR